VVTLVVNGIESSGTLFRKRERDFPLLKLCIPYFLIKSLQSYLKLESLLISLYCNLDLHG
jgi:hypothetical protein